MRMRVGTRVILWLAVLPSFFCASCWLKSSANISTRHHARAVAQVQIDTVKTELEHSRLTQASKDKATEEIDAFEPGFDAAENAAALLEVLKRELSGAGENPTALSNLMVSVTQALAAGVFTDVLASKDFELSELSKVAGFLKTEGVSTELIAQVLAETGEVSVAQAMKVLDGAGLAPSQNLIEKIFSNQGTITVGSPAVSPESSKTPLSFALEILEPANSSLVKSNNAVVVSGRCSENGQTVNVSGFGLSTDATAVCSSGSFSAVVTLSAGDGSKLIKAGMSDALGNIVSASTEITLDTTAPNLTLISPPNGLATSAGGIILSGACETGLLVYFTGDVLGGTESAGCTNSSYAKSITFSNGDGAKSVAVTQTDLAGNTNPSLSRIVTRDQTIPIVSIDAPSAASINVSGSSTFILSFSDTAGSGVSTVDLTSGSISKNVTGTATCSTINIDGAGTTSRSVTLSGCTGNGTVSLSLAPAAISDFAGNTSGAVGPSVAVTVDNIAPSITSVFPSENTKIKNTFTLTGNCETGLDVSIAGAGISSSPVSIPCSGGSFSQALTLAGPEGSTLLTLTQTDAAGNQGQTSRTLVRDSTAPALSIASPAASTLFSNQAVGTALTGSCETGFTVVLEGDVAANQSTTCLGNSYSFSSWELSSGDGSKTVTVAQTDAAGNRGTASSLFVLDTADVPLSSAVVFNSQVLTGLHATVTGQCDSNAVHATSVTVTSGTATVFSQSCISNVLTVNLTNMLEGRNSVTLLATVTRISNGATRTSSATFSQQFFCPQGYVGVPGKFATESDVTGLGHGDARAGHSDYAMDPTRDFCVMKYPAKVATSNNGGQSAWEPVYDGNKIFTMANYWPQSRADSTPWVSISRDNAIDRCNALNEAHGLCSGANCSSSFDNSQWGYRLLTNTQWQVIARNMEKTGANWTGGAENSGFLWRGHSDDAVGSNTDLYSQTYTASIQKSLSHPRSDSGSDYFGTGNSASQNSSGTAGWQERRRFVLSNGSSVWDMAGNVFHWVADNNSCADSASAGINGCMGVSSGLRSAWAWWEFSNAGFSASDRLLFSSLGNYTSSKNAGQMYGYGDPAGGVLRGGAWAGESYRGIFAATLSSPPSTVNTVIGFRCSFLAPLAPNAPLDTAAPSVPTVGRVDDMGSNVSNTAVTVAAGGLWHLAIENVTDAANAGVNATKLRVTVRRKIASTNSDFPTSADPVYRSGFNHPSSFNVPNTNDLTQ